MVKSKLSQTCDERPREEEKGARPCLFLLQGEDKKGEEKKSRLVGGAQQATREENCSFLSLFWPHAHSG